MYCIESTVTVYIFPKFYSILELLHIICIFYFLWKSVPNALSSITDCFSTIFNSMKDRRKRCFMNESFQKHSEKQWYFADSFLLGLA